MARRRAGRGSRSEMPTRSRGSPGARDRLRSAGDSAPRCRSSGSARTPDEHPHYEFRAGRSALGGRLRGDHRRRRRPDGGRQPRRPRRRGLSVGCNIELPREQKPNVRRRRAALSPFLRAQGDVRPLRLRFRDRPGRIRHPRRLFEALTLIQTATIRHFPAILVGDGEWNGLLDWLRRRARRPPDRAADLDSPCT